MMFIIIMLTFFITIFIFIVLRKQFNQSIKNPNHIKTKFNLNLFKFFKIEYEHEEKKD